MALHTFDKVLLTSLQKGDREAFNALFIKYSPKVYFFCLKYFKNQVEAEEIVQDVFLRIWETRNKIDVTKPFNTYLIAIAKHIIFDAIRRQAVKRRFTLYLQESSSGSYDLGHELDEKNLREYLLMTIGQLPLQQRSILLLKSNGYNNSEIARRLRLSKRTVETHVNRALKYLRLQLKQVMSFVW